MTPDLAELLFLLTGYLDKRRKERINELLPEDFFIEYHPEKDPLDRWECGYREFIDKVFSVEAPTMIDAITIFLESQRGVQ